VSSTALNACGILSTRTAVNDADRGSRAPRIACMFVVATGIAWSTGCHRGGGDDTTVMPPVDPSAAANNVIELYDKDGSGSLDETELAACPGLLAARARYDRDGDGQISQDEITNRFSSMFQRGTAWITVNCQVLQGGRPLAGAKVRLAPESFLEDALPPAEGTTDSQGRVTPTVADDRVPESLKGSHVMQPGIYRVEVEHPRIKQPHKPLGCEIDELARGGTNVQLRL
jgi:hypothetical protein